MLAGLLLLAAAPLPPGGMVPARDAAGMIDASPLFRTEAALRATPGVANVRIDPGGWRIELAPGGSAQQAAARACALLANARFRADTRVRVAQGQRMLAEHTCGGPQAAPPRRP